MILYLLALISLVIGMGAIFTLVEKFPVKLLYYHYHYRKPLIWSIFISAMIWQLLERDSFVLSSIFPLLIISLSVLLTYKVHQSNWFKAEYFPKMTDDIASLPLLDSSEMAVIEYEGITKAYSLDYVVHHHIVNDRFGDKIVALTYCAMCRSIIPFEVTDIGPLFVASFKEANMIVADKKTGTFFQQASFNSIIGQLHPHSLDMLPFQILPWKSVKSLNPIPQIAQVVKSDMRPFNLPLPGVWEKVMSFELTPGLVNKDKTLPSKTRVIGIKLNPTNGEVVYIKSEIVSKEIIRNEEFGFTLIAIGNAVVGFQNKVAGQMVELSMKDEQLICDSKSDTKWNVMGKYHNGLIKSDLDHIPVSDEYWFSWKKFHPKSELIRM